MEANRSSRRTLTGATTFSSTNTFTATMAPGWGRTIRPAGPELSPGRCTCSPPRRPSKLSNSVKPPPLLKRRRQPAASTPLLPRGANDRNMSEPLYPSLYQINTRVWMTELARELGRAATLKDVPDAELDRIAKMGFDW